MSKANEDPNQETGATRMPERVFKFRRPVPPRWTGWRDHARHADESANHKAAEQAQSVTLQTARALEPYSRQIIIDRLGRRWETLARRLDPDQDADAVRRPLELYVTIADEEARIAIEPGTFGAGIGDIAIDDGDGGPFLLDPPNDSRDLLLQIELVPGALAIGYLADPQLIRYYVQGVRSIAGWTLVWDNGSLEATRADVDSANGNAITTGTYYVRIGRAAISANGRVAGVTNYKYGHLALNLCTGGDLIIATIDPTP